jgi:DNA-binding transcriptional ArsR family regulator
VAPAKPTSRANAAKVLRPRDAAPLFAALGDETQLQLLRQLVTKGSASIAQLSGTAVVSRQAITKHLQVLAEAGYVKGTRCGREHLWQLRPKRLVEVRE